MSMAIVLMCQAMAIDSKNAYVFVPGKNWRLSIAELAAYFEARDYCFDFSEFEHAFFAVNLDEGLSASVANDLGGTIKVGKVVTKIATSTVREAFLEGSKEARAHIRTHLSASNVVSEMVETASAKLLFGVSVYSTDQSFNRVSRSAQRFVGSSLKHELKAQGRKSGFMGFPRTRPQPQLSHVEVLKKGLVEKKAEVLFCIGKKQTLVSTTMAVHNPFEFQERDVCRPVQRRIFSMPPRLARIMINLAFCTVGKSLLDPFCGVGTILQEALLARAKVIGVDVNPWCVEAAQTNLAWLKRKYRLEAGEYTVLQGDSRRLTMRCDQEVDCIATEPDLGPALRNVATKPYAIKIINKVTPLYFDFLESAYVNLKKGGRLVLTTPRIKTRSGKPVSLDVGNKAANVGFKRVAPLPRDVVAGEANFNVDLTDMTYLVDSEERHKIGREIHIFQK